MKYKDKEWSRTRNNLEFVPEHISKKLAVGVEVKNTLPIIEREELDIKLEMCEYLGMVSTLPHLRL
jgi:hypothetical protein